MSAGFSVIGIDELRPLLNRSRVLAAIRQALIWQAEGNVQSPLPGQLLFDKPHGDCHIKFGHVAGSRTFAIKVAVSNPERRLFTGMTATVLLPPPPSKRGWLASLLGSGS